jgi:hypothetical protein
LVEFQGRTLHHHQPYSDDDIEAQPKIY